MQKKTKILATIGPASSDKKTLSRLKKAGVDAVRLNFSHGDYDQYDRIIERWESVLESEGEHGAVIADLAGPEVRTTELLDEPVRMQDGDEIRIATDAKGGADIAVNYEGLSSDVSAGDEVLIDDGRIALTVLEASPDLIQARVNRGGEITTGRRGVNVPSGLSLPALTDKDKDNLSYALKQYVDYVALSFVKTADDIKSLRSAIDGHDADPHIIAKIETKAAVENIESIIKAADAIMVARGDLAVEIGVEKVPAIQKDIIRKCNRAGVPTITATEMLQSMTESTTPTRAEVSDVANAVLDGSDAVMLSGETATGDNPVRSAEVMRRVVQKIEGEKERQPDHEHMVVGNDGNQTVDAITVAAVHIAHDVDAGVIVALTDSGFTARMIARFHPGRDIIAFSRFDRTCRKLALCYGCRPRSISGAKSLEEVVPRIKNNLQAADIVGGGDKIVIAAGLGGTQSRHTNTVFVDRI